MIQVNYQNSQELIRLPSVTVSPEAARLYKKICNINSRHIVTADDLYENASYDQQEKILNGIKELRTAGLITTYTTTNHSRFETQLIPVDGKFYEKGAPQKITRTNLVVKRKR